MELSDPNAQRFRVVLVKEQAAPFSTECPLLAEAAEQDPLVCLVDDAHWLDHASADALVF